ncbi:MAG: hypothetical protein JSS51_06320 [Planctomycetes bacterium]|nr:hypothetical protein [Planctomycetota bacterium]
MQSIREILQKPWFGWSIAGIAILFALFTVYRYGFAGDGPYDPRRLQQEVVIHFTDTGEDLKMPRGQFEAMLRERGKSLNPNQGITNPATGKPTGFLVAKHEWEETVQRIKAEADSTAQLSPWGQAPGGSK